jgi:hypothetical protein
MPDIQQRVWFIVMAFLTFTSYTEVLLHAFSWHSANLSPVWSLDITRNNDMIKTKQLFTFSSLTRLSTWPSTVYLYSKSPWHDERKPQCCQPKVRIKCKPRSKLRKITTNKRRMSTAVPWKLSSHTPVYRVITPRLAFMKYNPLFVHFFASSPKVVSSITSTSVLLQIMIKLSAYLRSYDGNMSVNETNKDKKLSPSLGCRQFPVAFFANTVLTNSR